MSTYKDSQLLPPKKHCKARGEEQGVGDAQATPAGEGVSPSSALPVSGCPPPTPPAAGTAKMSQSAPATSSPAAKFYFACAAEYVLSRGEEYPRAFQPLRPGEISHTDHLTWSAGMLVEFLLEKYKMKERITQTEMQNIIHRKFRDHFPEILCRATDCMELILGLDLIKIYPTNDSYILVGKLGFPNEGSLSSDPSFPKDGILMLLLGFICLNDNSITEEKMWEFLNEMRIYAGRSHVMVGEPRKFITEDLVQLRYLEHKQVPSSDPPRYEFLWGPRAHAQTTKLEVICFFTKAHHRALCTFQALHQLALRIEKERAWAGAAAGTHSRFMWRSSSQPWSCLRQSSAFS